MDSYEADAVVVGAGVVGLACARALALAGREVLILEAEDRFGSVTSSRNSEVIHAGIYYPAGSLKARLCVAGKRAMYDYAGSHNIAHKRITKLIVACEKDELGQLGAIKAKALANGVDDLEEMSAAQAVKMEPELSCAGALLSPSTGIIDSHGLMLSLLGEAQDHGAMLALNTPVKGVEVRNDGFSVVTGGSEPIRFKARSLVNSAGLGAQALAGAIQGLDQAHVPALILSKGCYFVLTGKSPFTRLIYPTPPNTGGLGVHVTLDLAGQCRFGPDAEYVDEIDYDVDPARADVMYAAVRRYWPRLEDGAIQPGYAGMRPKVGRGVHGVDDFVIQGPDTHGVAGLVNLFGIESPGLTSSLAIADEVARLLEH